MKIALVGNYPPRQCGIATFTQHLAFGISDAAGRRGEAVRTEVIAINDNDAEYDYPAEVNRTIRQHDRLSYIRIAETLNRSDVDVVVVQHEFGIFGGEAGSYIVDFAERLRKPLIVTMHTVLREPNDQQRLVVLRLARLAQRLVVMSKLAVRILRQAYRLPASVISCVEHGAPEFDYSRRQGARDALGLGERHTLLTFGLLGRGKGIETAIEGLPAVKAVCPDFVYILLGKTHPHVLKHEGEAYRDSLWQRVEELGLADNVRFVSEYVDEDTLADYLLAADTYVLPYPNEAQITSGTLSYAVAAGCAVVSTPFWHAKELLANGRGQLFPFNNGAVLGDTLAKLIQNPEAHRELRRQAKAYGRSTTWAAQGGHYLDILEEVRASYTPQRARMRKTSQLPPLDLQHIRRITDDTGMLQHATFHLPNAKEGYCLDDNVRAMIFCAQALEHGAKVSDIEPLLDKYLALTDYLQLPDGRFHNFIGYDRNYLDRVGSDDSFGRTIWALGRLLNSPAVSQDHKDIAWHIYQGARPHIAKLRSLRAVAFCVIGLSELSLTEQYSENVAALSRDTAEFLLAEYAAATDGDWHWFEPVLTYGNAILPLAILKAASVTKDERYITVARATTVFLEQYTFSDRMIRPVGCHNFMRRGEQPSRYDQQPLDAMAMVYLYTAWYEFEGDERDLQKAIIAYEWFAGLNDLGLPLYNLSRGSCFDGLMEHGVNRNQGAESTLAFWMSRNELSAALQRANATTVGEGASLRTSSTSIKVAAAG